MIDVIVPIYNTNIKQLQTCLTSIASQTIAEELEITIVDDGSSITDPEQDILFNKIKTFIPLQVLRYKNNHGPGYARQYGIDHTFNEYIVFIDADDMFAPVAAETLLKGFLAYPDKAISMGTFYDLQTDTMITKEVEIQLSWVFSKMYKRSVINKYGFKFNTNEECSYGNEDVGFNCQYQYVLGHDCTVWIEQPLYYWSSRNKKSITRNNNGEYDYNQGYKGYVMNFIHTYNRLKETVPKERSEWYSFKHLFDIYDYYDKNRRIVENDSRIKERLLGWSYLYYKEVFQEFDNQDGVLLKEYWDSFIHFNKNRNFELFCEEFLLPLRHWEEK